jgi:hypothetical protein
LAIRLTARPEIVTITGMNKLISYCVIILAAAICGCTEPQTIEEAPSIEGLKITDLTPSTAEKLPPALSLKLYTFEMPVKNLPIMASLFSGLSQSNIHFTNRKAFSRNAFTAGIGGKDMWALTGNQLKAAKAKKISTSNIIIRDKSGYEMPVKEIMDRVSLTYIDITTKIVQRSLRGGILAWRIKAGPAMQRKGTATIRIEPLLRELQPSLISKVAENEEFGLTVFKSNSMTMLIEEGQFLILAPQSSLAKADKGSARSMSLAEIFFLARGDFVTPQQNGISGAKEKHYDFQRNIPLVRIYMLLCMEVQN